MREQRLNELQGTSILTKSFFNKLIRRIECTKPLAGEGITISEKENGFEISGSVITINVCSNGQPAQIVVFGRPV